MVRNEKLTRSMISNRNLKCKVGTIEPRVMEDLFAKVCEGLQLNS